MKKTMLLLTAVLLAGCSTGKANVPETSYMIREIRSFNADGSDYGYALYEYDDYYAIASVEARDEYSMVYYSFDSLGNNIKEETVELYLSNYISACTREFNENGDPVSEVCHDTSNGHEFTNAYAFEYEYDEDGNMTSETVLNDDGYKQIHLYEYDNAGNNVRTTYNSNDPIFPTVYLSEFDEDGKMVSTSGYRTMNGKIEAAIENDDYFYKAEFEYGEDGNVMKASYYDAGLVYHYEYEYDENGNLAKATSYGENGEMLGWSEYSYAEVKTSDCNITVSSEDLIANYGIEPNHPINMYM